jgi:hypothetical protein
VQEACQEKKKSGACGEGFSALVPDVHKIAVLRANGLGDFIVALPAPSLLSPRP